MSKSKEQLQEGVVVKDRVRIDKPKMYKVILLNDDYTTMDFVVQILHTIFNLSTLEAERVMLNVHNQGSGVAGIYPKEIAETKVHTVHLLAKQNGHPLKCVMEAE